MASQLVFDKFIDMVLGSVLGSRDLEDICDAKKSFLSIPVGDHLKIKRSSIRFFNVKSVILYLEYCEVFQHTVHHVLLWKMFEFENKVDHIFTHRGPVEFVNKPSTFKSGIFGLNFLDHLFSETANFCGALNGHVFCTFVTAKKEKNQ